MQKAGILLIIVQLLLTLVSAGQNKMLTMKDAVIGQWRNLSPETIHGYWQPETQNITYKKDKKLWQYNVAKASKEAIISFSELNNILRETGKDTLQRLPSPRWISKNRLFIRNGQERYVLNIETQNIESTCKLEKNDRKPDYPEGFSKKQIAVLNDGNLYIVSPEKRTEVAASDNEAMVYGDYVSRREFGIAKGTFWSPGGNLLAYYIKDNSDVKEYPLVDITKRAAEPKMIQYPMAGMGTEHVSLGVYNIKTQKTINIENNNPDSEKYLTNITWGPDANYIYIQVLNRAQNHMKLNQYNAKTGKLVKTLFEEKHEKYVEPYHKLKFLPGDAEHFIYQSRRDDYNHLYHYNISGKLIQQLTTGQWEVTEFLGFDNKGKNLFYVSTEESPLERHAYKINLKKPRNKTRLTQRAGTHRVKISPSGRYLFDRFSSKDTPGIVQVINTKTGEKQTLLKAENPLKDYKLGKMTIGTIKADDKKTDLYYRLIRPADFDPEKKYPVIVYVYGGPHAQLIKNKWLGNTRLWHHYMAQRGYIMLTVDNRGSANRGLAFENIIHRQCGKVEMQDQLKGIELIESLKYADTSRIGIHGWSYGGFMTTSLLTHHPETFKVGVAGGPVIDWKYYEVMYGERYMDTPEENPEGYQSTSLIPMAKKLKRKLLIIHGGIDPTVVQQHSLVFVRECIKNNVPVDYFIYPRAEHNVRGYDRIHLMQKVTDYFNKNLK